VYHCIPVDLSVPRNDKLSITKSARGSLDEGGPDRYKLNLTSFNRAVFPRGLRCVRSDRDICSLTCALVLMWHLRCSLFVRLLPEDAYLKTPTSWMVALYSDATKHLPENDRYSHMGFYDLQTSPQELQPAVYYVIVRNAFGRPTNYDIHFDFDAPREVMSE
jgi:hypothetical protein